MTLLRDRTYALVKGITTWKVRNVSKQATVVKSTRQDWPSDIIQFIFILFSSNNAACITS